MQLPRLLGVAICYSLAFAQQLQPRQDNNKYIEQSLYFVAPWNGEGAFYTNISIGTPLQTIITILDLTTSGIVIPSTNDTSDFSLQSSISTLFNTNRSSTVTTKAIDAFNLTAGYNESAILVGNLVTDNIQLGTVAVSDIEFGIATDLEGWLVVEYLVGLLGLSYGLDVATPVAGPSNNLLEQLVEAGAIDSRVFSLFFGDAGNLTGSIVLGGLDVSRYSDELVTLDIIPVAWPSSTGGYTYTVLELAFSITDIYMTLDNHTEIALITGADLTGQQSDSLPVLPDTQVPIWEITTDLYEYIAQLIPGLDADSRDMPCDQVSQNVSFVIRFGDAINITVPIQDLVIPQYTPANGNQMAGIDGTPTCKFAMSPADYSLASGTIYHLGWSVLRNMYMVFDLDNGQISLAPTRLDAGVEANIHAIPAGANGLSQALKSAGKSVATAASSNSYIDASLVSALPTSSDSGSGSHSVHTTSIAVGQATGIAAIPAAGTSAPITVATRGRLTAASSAQASSTSTSTSKGAAARDRGGQGRFSLVLAEIVVGVVGYFLAYI